MTTDFGATAEDYARFRAGFPASLFDRLAAAGIGTPSDTVVDVGTGTGALGRGFAARGARVIGIVPSPHLLDEARKLDVASGVQVEYKVGSAESIPVPDDIADVACAGQCWHWFDPVAAAREMHRIVRPGGRVVVAYLDWLPLESLNEA